MNSDNRQDIIDIDDIANCINNLALEIENLPFAPREQQEPEQVKQEALSAPVLSSSTRRLPFAPSVTETEASVSSTCYFKTKTGGKKEYQILITQD